MNLKKLVAMSREENPNPFLAKLSIHWEKENKQGNPVKIARSVLRWQQAFKIITAGMIFYLIGEIIWKFHMVAKNENFTLWAIVGLTLFWLLTCSLHAVLSGDSKDQNSKHFISAISTLEMIIGKPIEEWSDKDNLQGKSEAFLKEKADALVTAEKIEKEEQEHRPWSNVRKEKSAVLVRKEFNVLFYYLTSALPISQDKSIYFDKKNKKKLLSV